MTADLTFVTSWVQLAIAVIGLIMAVAVFDTRREIKRRYGARRARRGKRRS